MNAKTNEGAIFYWPGANSKSTLTIYRFLTITDKGVYAAT